MTLVALMLILSNAIAWAQGGGGTESLLDDASVARVVDDLESFVVEAVRAGGADLEQRHAHWVFVFSTGHFPGEPIRAELEPWWLAVAGRGGQVPLVQGRDDPQDERVEIVVEYCMGEQCARDEVQRR